MMYFVAVISGGFLPLANYVKNELELDWAFANQVYKSDIFIKMTHFVAAACIG
jgi:phosphoserine phosphatase